MNKGLGIALFAAAAIVVAGCAGNNSKEARERNPAPCPNVVVLNDAARMVEFAGDPALENVAWSAEIIDAKLDCRYFATRPIDSNLRLSIAVGRGPAATDEKHVYRYFVAVTRRNMEVIAKKNFEREVDFGKRESIKIFEEKINEIVIPRAREEISGVNFEIVVGLAVTREQAIYNRAGKSLKFPDL